MAYMKRREFLKTAGVTVAGLAAGLPVALSQPTGQHGTVRADDRCLPIIGSPFLKTADALVDLHRGSFSELTERIMHFHMPPQWQAIEVLGIDIPLKSNIRS